MAKTKVVRGLCTVDGCAREHKARGYCAGHYQHYLRDIPVLAEIKTRDRTVYDHCSEDGCSEPVKAKGVCQKHYARLLRHGHTKHPDRKRPAKICSISDCDSHAYAKGMCHQHYIRAQRAKSKYGISAYQVEQMVLDQKGKCGICGNANTAVHGLSGKVFALSLDHDHTTGAVRGMLCHQCNRALGMFGDSPVTLSASVAYLAKHSPDPVATLDAAISALQLARGALQT